MVLLYGGEYLLVVPREHHHGPPQELRSWSQAIRALVSCCLTNLAAHSFGRSMLKQKTQRRARLRFPTQERRAVGRFAVVHASAIDPVIVLWQAIMAGAKKKPHFLAQARFLPKRIWCVLSAEEQPTAHHKTCPSLPPLHSRVFSKDDDDDDGHWLCAVNHEDHSFRLIMISREQRLES
jgi:hypothetical protein